MRQFSDLFRGRDDAYGTYSDVSHTLPDEKGKRVARAQTKREPVTQGVWDAHLAGKSRMGIVPVLKDRKCWWFVIDVDLYKEKGLHEDIANRITECGLPLVQTCSKSGGAHLWCFLSEPIEAAKARSVAENFRHRLKLPATAHVDIFPAQDKADDVGNWVNLPYFGDTCWCVGETGAEKLSLDDFLVYANDRVQHPSDLNIQSKQKTKASKSDAPPCIDFMRENGLPEGFRNNGITQFAVYALKSKGDDWKEAVQEFNETACETPVHRAELSTIFKSVQVGKYQYMCDKIAPLYCDKKECKLREYGIGRAKQSANDILIQRLEKIDGEEPVYRVTMKGKRFQIGLSELFLYTAFKKAALGAINEFLPMIKQSDWEPFMNDQLQLMEIEDAAADTQMRDRVISLFHAFTENTTTESLSAAYLSRLPYYDGEHLIFRGDDFMQIVDRQLNKLPREKTWAIMRDFGCVLSEHNVDGNKVKFWTYIPDGELWFDPYKRDQA